MIQYRLVPPFLHVPEASSFADAWEDFCCKILNLEHRTNEIFTRTPPEQGVDIYYSTGQIAYQCKSVESGKAGDFNVSHAIASWQAALTVQVSLGWKTYALCTNVDLTGTAVARLKEAIPHILLLPASYWVQACERHTELVARNFRVVVDIAPRGLPYGNRLGDIDNLFGPDPAPGDPDRYIVLLYTNRNDSLYRLPVDAQMTVEELVNALIYFFKLPGSATFQMDGMSATLSHALAINRKAVPFNQTLAQAGIGPGSIVTYWTTMRWTDEQGEFDGHVAHLQTIGGFGGPRSRRERMASASASYKRMIECRLDEIDRELIAGSTLPE